MKVGFRIVSEAGRRNQGWEIGQTAKRKKGGQAAALP
jgi:hypothetical protein